MQKIKKPNRPTYKEGYCNKCGKQHHNDLNQIALCMNNWAKKEQAKYRLKTSWK